MNTGQKSKDNNVEAARNAGVHLAFFSGNEVYWKTRWESNNGSEDRTLVCYKEGFMGRWYAWLNELAELNVMFLHRSGQACGEQEPIMMLVDQKMH